MSTGRLEFLFDCRCLFLIVRLQRSWRTQVTTLTVRWVSTILRNSRPML